MQSPQFKNESFCQRLASDAASDDETYANDPVCSFNNTFGSVKTVDPLYESFDHGNLYVRAVDMPTVAPLAVSDTTPSCSHTTASTSFMNKPPSKSKRRMFLAVGLNTLLSLAAIILAVLVFVEMKNFEVVSVADRVTQSSAAKDHVSSCNELRRKGVIQNGIYQIQPNRAAPAIHTYCDMTTDEGGWTLVASIHENNINGKCTVGDKWSSEQPFSDGIAPLEASGSWQNYDVFGHIEAVTSNDYKNTAYSYLKVSDVMIWHVPNDVNAANLERDATFKYFTSGSPMSEFNSSLGEYYTKHFPMVRKFTAASFVVNVNSTITTRYGNIREAVPDFYDYLYDRGTQANAINDGGSDMYDNGNRVSFVANNATEVKAIYGRNYFDKSLDYSVVSGAFHPFIFLAWIGNKNQRLTSFGIKVTSNVGADGRGNHATETGDFRSTNYRIWFRSFQVYNATDPTVCEVYFYVAHQKRWSSTVGNTMIVNWSAGTDQLLNRVDFANFQNVLTGYILLSRDSGKRVSRSSIQESLRRLVFIIDDVPFSNDDNDNLQSAAAAFPVTFAKGNAQIIGSSVPRNQIPFVTPGYLQMGAYSEEGFPYPLCPGVRLNNGSSAASNCVGGIFAQPISVCGDFAGWGGSGTGLAFNESNTDARSLNDIHSSILIFTRG